LARIGRTGSQACPILIGSEKTATTSFRYRRPSTISSNCSGWIQQKVKEFGVSDPENWIKRKIPALGDRSVLETLKSSNGEEVLRNYFAKVIGRF
jgi:hypothetical protein